MPDRGRWSSGENIPKTTVDEGNAAAEVHHVRQYVWDPIGLGWIRAVQAGVGGGGGGPATIVDGGDVAQGAIADLAVVSDTSGTLSGKLRGLVKWAFERMPASLGQKTMAASLPVVIASDQSALTVAAHAVTNAGTFAVQADTELPAAAALADAAANPSVPGVGGYGLLWNGATWDRAKGDTTNGAWVNIKSSVALTVGTHAVTEASLDAAIAAQGAAAPANVVIAGLRNSAGNADRLQGLSDNADGVATTSGGNVVRAVAEPFVFNGATFDRERGNWNTTTGDTGAKTTNFTGATQMNFNARGAIITAILGAVSGTITTFQTGIEWSPDGGTTWLGFTPLGANVTTPANGNTFVWFLYPTNWSQAAGGTPANLAPSATAPTQSNFINAVLPRTWRWKASIAGTTPSITVTSVQVNYVL